MGSERDTRLPFPRFKKQNWAGKQKNVELKGDKKRVQKAMAVAPVSGPEPVRGRGLKSGAGAEKLIIRSDLSCCGAGPGVLTPLVELSRAEACVVVGITLVGKLQDEEKSDGEISELKNYGGKIR